MLLLLLLLQMGEPQDGLLGALEALFADTEAIVIAGIQVRGSGRPTIAASNRRSSCSRLPRCCCCCNAQALRVSHDAESTGAQLLKALGAKV